jgi:hypothetical protein
MGNLKGPPCLSLPYCFGLFAWLNAIAPAAVFDRA